MRLAIKNFIDFNYEEIALDITGVDKEELRKKLEADHVNHLYELDNARYIAIWNCDLQGFETMDDIFFDPGSSTYVLAKLGKDGDNWFADIVRYSVHVKEDKLHY